VESGKLNLGDLLTDWYLVTRKGMHFPYGNSLVDAAILAYFLPSQIVN
jgi:hypothetical protein